MALAHQVQRRKSGDVVVVDTGDCCLFPVFLFADVSDEKTVSFV